MVIRFENNGAEILAFDLDESGNHTLISGDDSWFDYNYQVVRGGEVYTSVSNQALWAQGLKEDYESAGLNVTLEGLDLAAAPAQPQPPKEFNNASEFNQFDDEEPMTDEEIAAAGRDLERGIQKEARRKKIIIFAIVLLIFAAACVYAWTKIFRDPGPDSTVFLNKSFAALDKGLSTSGEFKLTLSAEGAFKAGTGNYEGKTEIVYSGKFSPGRLQLVPETLPGFGEDAVEPDPNTTLDIRTVDEILFIDGTMYILSAKKWLAVRLVNQYNLPKDLKSVNNSIPKGANPGADITPLLKIRQTFAGPTLDGGETKTWELDSNFRPEQFSAAGDKSAVDAKALAASTNLYFVSEQETFLPRVMRLELSGDPTAWIPPLKEFASSKGAEIKAEMTFDSWGEPMEITAPKKVTYISAAQLQKMATPDTTASFGLTPEMIQQAFKGTLPAAGASGGGGIGGAGMFGYADPSQAPNLDGSGGGQGVIDKANNLGQ